jgi:outer membrane lipopolysaccharide assembly protein LptE/RlpB
MAKKNKVLFDPPGIDAVNWAMVCHLKPHQLAYRINLACGWKLQRLKNLKQNQPAKTGGFALYNYSQNDMQPEYFLIALKDDKSFLIRDLKQFDYILQIRLHDEDTKWNPVLLMEQIRQVENMLGVFEVNASTLKSADTLYFDKQLDGLELKEPEQVRKKIIKLTR